MRRLFFWLHLSTALLAGSIVLVMALTGVILAYAPQITHWVEREFRFPAEPRTGPILALGALAERAEAYGEGKRLTALMVWSDPQRNPVAWYDDNGQLWIDAATGEKLGPGALGIRAFFETVTELHRWLAFSGEARDGARRVTGICNLALLFLIGSGLYLWWPRTWSTAYLRAALWFKRGLSRRGRLFNWHHVIGFWMAPLLLVATLTGAVISFSWASDLLFQLTGNPVPERRAKGPRPGKNQKVEDATRERVAARPVTSYPIHDLKEQLNTTKPGWFAFSILWPEKPTEPVTVFVNHRDSVAPNSRSSYTLDSRTGELSALEGYADLNSGQQLRQWIRPLHTGEALGVVGQTLMGIAALGTVFLVYSGFVLAWYRLIVRRKRRWSATDKSKAGLAEGSVLELE